MAMDKASGLGGRAQLCPDQGGPGVTPWEGAEYRSWWLHFSRGLDATRQSGVPPAGLSEKISPL